jgi:hypothetical protein
MDMDGWAWKSSAGNGMDARMNPVAIAVMLGILVAWAGLLAAALYLGNPLLLAIFAVVSVAMFIRWDVFG